MQDLPFPDRRKSRDRRARHTNPFSFTSLFGSRSRFRRQEDRERLYLVDRYSPRATIAVFGIILLSILDAFLTMKLIDLGAAREANPIMDFFLRLGPLTFLMVKYALTVGSVLVCLILKNYRVGGRIPVKWVILSVLAGYAVLILYELSLFLRFGAGL